MCAEILDTWSKTARLLAGPQTLIDSKSGMHIGKGRMQPSLVEQCQIYQILQVSKVEIIRRGPIRREEVVVRAMEGLEKVKEETVDETM